MTSISTAMTDHLRDELKRLLAATDELVANADAAQSSEEMKDWIRRAHQDQRRERLKRAADFISQREDDVISCIANGDEVDPYRIEPIVTPVLTQHDKDLWRYASLTWSVPVSEGYGRRTKFIVKDRQNNKLVAIFALGDPVIGLGPRDEAIGWTTEQRHARLYNVYDAFVLGAVDPYRQLLGGKLAALLALANETRNHLTNKYRGTTTVLREEQKDPTPVLITTSSALGRSAVYNRLTYFERKAFQPVGYTRGFGHFHIPEDTFRQLALFIKAEGSNVQGAYGRGTDGGGSNYRFRVIRTALKELGLPMSGLQHGVKRQVFLAPLADNWTEFLRGETDQIDHVDMPVDEIAEYYRLRWAIPRAQRRPEFRDWDRDNFRLSREFKVPIQASLSQAFSNAAYVSPEMTGIGAHTEDAPAIRLDQQTGGHLEVEFRGITYQLTIRTKKDGTRTLVATSVEPKEPQVQGLLRAHPVKLATAPLQPHLVVADLRVAMNTPEGGITTRLVNRQELEDLLGQSIDDLLPRSSGAIVGSRQELLRDSSRRKNQLCVMFADDDLRMAARLWVAIRLLPVVATTKAET